jgi:uncharacterized protein (DUF2249 family)
VILVAGETQALDVCWLPPPEPFERIIGALATLPPEGILQVHIHRQPYPLYDALRENGYAWKTTELPDGTYSIRISRSA